MHVWTGFPTVFWFVAATVLCLEIFHVCHLKKQKMAAHPAAHTKHSFDKLSWTDTSGDKEFQQEHTEISRCLLQKKYINSSVLKSNSCIHVWYFTTLCKNRCNMNEAEQCLSQVPHFVFTLFTWRKRGRRYPQHSLTILHRDTIASDKEKLEMTYFVYLFHLLDSKQEYTDFFLNFEFKHQRDQLLWLSLCSTFLL